MRLSLASLALLVSVSALAQTAPTITASGVAEIRVAPDEVILTLGVETFDGELAEAKRENDARMGRVLEAARAAGVPDERLTTDYVSIAPDYDYSPRQLRGFVVRRSLEVRLRDLDAFEGLLTAALDAGATHVHGVDFRTTELRHHRDEARALALDAAREKAEAMAARLGKTIGEPVSISEGYEGWSGGNWWGARGGALSQNVIQNAGAAPSVDGPTSPGQIAVTARVSVVFALTD